MSNYKNYVVSRMDFDNGYSVGMDSDVTGAIFTTLHLKGERVDVGQFMDKPGKNDGFTAFLKAEDFASFIYRVSKEPAQ